MKCLAVLVRIMRHSMLAAVAVIFVASGCTMKSPAPSGQVRQPAPEFSLPTLDGQQTLLSHLRGKVVVLDFWATWCPPCREALPHLQTLAASAELLERGLVVLAVNEQEQHAAIRAFLDGSNYAFGILQDADGLTARDYAVSTFPTTVIVGREGFVEAVITGWTPDTAHQIDEAVNRALEKPSR